MSAKSSSNPFSGGVGSNQVAAHRLAQKAAEKKAASPWLNAWTEPMAGIAAHSSGFITCGTSPFKFPNPTRVHATFSAVTVLPSCLLTASDLYGDGDTRLLVANAGEPPKVKVFRGTSLASELLLTDAPSAMAVFYPAHPNPKDSNAVPSLALASGATIYVYRNLRPHSKFMVPKVDFPSLEKEAWLRFKAVAAAQGAGGAGGGGWGGNGALASPMSASTPASPLPSVPSPTPSPSPSPGPNGQESKSGDRMSGYSQAIAAAAQALYSTLSTLRDNEVAFALTYRSGDFLSLPDEAQRLAYALAMVNQPLDRHVPITCLGVLNRSSAEEKAASSLVVGTEHAKLLFLNPHATHALFWVDLPAAPTSLVCRGLLDVDYRVYAACRDGRIYVARKDKPPAVAVSRASHIVDFVVTDANIIVATMDGCITAFSHRGHSDYALHMASPVVCTTVLRLEKVQHVEALLVALANGEVRLYNGKELVSTIPAVEGNVVTAMRFGSYGREDAALLLGYRSGLLAVKMLHRQTTFSAGDTGTSLPPPEQSIPLDIPAKTALFVQQTRREKDQATEMHDALQRALCKLRLSAARTLVNALTDGQGAVMAGASGLRLDAALAGLGPSFQLSLELVNTHSRPSAGLLLTIAFDASAYAVTPASIRLPALLPSLPYSFVVDVEATDPTAPPGTLRVYVSSPASSLPVLTASVQMCASQFV